MNLVQISIFLSLLISTKALGFYGLGNIHKVIFKELNSTLGLFDTIVSETAWIEQPLDHFDEKENRTWNMRYFKSLHFWKPGGPVYLYINGEWQASEAVFRTGILQDLAKETNGALYASEHRYYGKSKPFEELSTKNLAYLSSRQALADLAKLIKEIKMLPVFRTSKLVVIGGSYAGNLAAWMKLLYPDLVDAAISSSAPVLAKKDFFEYLESVSDNFEQYGTFGCHNVIKDMFNRYDQLFKTSAGIEQLKKEEEICNSTNMIKPENKQLFFLDKVNKFMYEAQYGNPDSLKHFCEEMEKSSAVTTKNDENDLWNTKNHCLNYDIDDMIESMKQIDWVTSWMYQVCTEFGYFMSSDSKNHPFTNNIPVDLYYYLCLKMYGSEFDEQRVDKGIQTTNKMYGGLKPNITHVVFVNGELDPWAKLGILEDVSYNAPAKVIPRSSHCADLYPNKSDELQELTDTKNYIKYLIKEWIGAE